MKTKEELEKYISSLAVSYVIITHDDDPNAANFEECHKAIKDADFNETELPEGMFSVCEAYEDISTNPNQLLLEINAWETAIREGIQIAKNHPHLIHEL